VSGLAVMLIVVILRSCLHCISSLDVSALVSMQTRVPGCVWAISTLLVCFYAMQDLELVP
jgi:hypothetical protein